MHLDDLQMKYIITNRSEEINSAEKIIFPGVGEASSAMDKLNEKDIVETIKTTTKTSFRYLFGNAVACNIF